MPVFNTAANQIQASPIRSYYQGEALRADTALREKQAEALQQEIDANLPERKQRVAEQTANTDAGNLKARWSELTRELNADQIESTTRASQAMVLSEKRGGSPEENHMAFASAFGPGFEEALGDFDGLIPIEFAQSWADASAEAYTLSPGSKRMLGDLEQSYNPKQPDTTASLTEISRLAENNTSASIRDFAEFIRNGGDPVEGASLLKPLLDPDEDAAELAKNIDNATSLIDDTIKLVSLTTTGIPGAIRRIWETGEGMKDPDADQPAKDLAEKVMLLQATNWREIVGSGQLSKADYTFLDGLFKGKGWMDDPAATKRSLNLLKDWLVSKKAVSNAVGESNSIYKRARDAIKAGADRNAVIERLIENGGDPENL